MRKRSAGTEEVVDRAMERERPERERRYIFNGNPPASGPGFAIRPNRRAHRRARSTFNIILLLFGGGILIVLYISHIIAVNRLALEVNQLQATYDKLQNANAVLRAEVSRKSGWERISRIAGEQLGLKHAKKQPVWLEVDEGKLDPKSLP